jgi:hypothetical protein
MSVEYVIDKERRLVVTTASDRVTFVELMAHQGRLLSDPNFSSDFDQLLDGTGVTILDITANELRQLTARQVFSPTSKRAFVAVNPAFFGVGRMAEAYHSFASTSSQSHVFYDLPSALKWLGLNESDVSGEFAGE